MNIQKSVQPLQCHKSLWENTSTVTQSGIMTPPSSTPEEQEFWLFIANAPLPQAEELQQHMFQLDECFKLKLSGAPEQAPEHAMQGEYLDEEGESQLDVCWIMETDDARKAFKRDQSALRQIGDRTKMLRFILEDECALGHVFAMMHAILTDRNGLLVIPDEQGYIILEHADALDFLEQEIREE